MPAGQLYIVSAPSGAGKTSLVNAAVERIPRLVQSVSHTTRPMRPGEENGVHYHFISHASFEAMIAESAFLECARVFDNYYGTSWNAIERPLAEGIDVILEIDWQGARQVRERRADALSVFVLPPSREALRQRLTERGQDDAATISRRMRGAIEEMSHWNEYDYLIVNEHFDDALAQFEHIVCATRLRRDRQAACLAPMLTELLTD